ncbi:MAG: sugar transferase [Verrucomicrobiota bacterium]
MPIESRKAAFSIQLMQLLDALLIWLAFWLAGVLRDPLFDFLQGIALRWFDYPMFKDPIDPLAAITWMLFIVVPFTPLTLELFGFYGNPLQQGLRRSFSRVVKSFAVMGLVVLGLAVLLKFPLSSRLVLATALPLAMAFVLLRDAAVSRFERGRAKRGIGLEHVLFAGEPTEIEQFRADLSEGVTDYWKVVGEFDLSSHDWEGFRDQLNQEAVERVIFVVNQADFGEVSEAIEICELQGIEAWVAADFIRTQIARPTFDVLDSRPMLVLRSTPDLSWSLLAKGVMDRVGAVLLLLATIWIWPLVALMIKLQSPGSVFYRQTRAGRYGKPFTLLKFRSMFADADQRLEEVKRTRGNEMTGPVFKLKDDPRIFPFGRFMRRFSIDELPQLINVIAGDMSLVGPRPLPVYEAEAIESSSHRRRMSMRPGITCLWQVAGRNEVSDFSDWVALDLRYIDNWSLGLDLMILLKTVPAVIGRKGAS